MLSCGEFCASVIQECFSISQLTISCHMKILVSAGVRVKDFLQEIKNVAAKKGL